jgi:hypothetical protein
MGGMQDPAPQPAPSSAPAASTAPSALNTFVASMSRVELLVLAGGALMLLLDFIGWFVSGFGVSSVAVAASVVGVVMVLLRKAPPSGTAAIYWAILFLVALVAAFMGARGVIVDLLFVFRPPAGASPALLINLLALVVASAAMAWAAMLMWRGRSA